MTLIKIEQDPEEPVISITAQGHSNTRTCAAISAIMQTTLLGLKQVAEEYPDEVMVVENGKQNTRTFSP